MKFWQKALGVLGLWQATSIISDGKIEGPIGITRDAFNPIDENYPISAELPYGPKFGENPPPGYPIAGRKCGVKNSAKPAIRAWCSQNGCEGEAFHSFLLWLGKNESVLMLGRPADRFDVRPPESRPAGDPYVSAWGVFQPNDGFWVGVQSGPKSKKIKHPWQGDVAQEVGLPAARLKAIWDEGIALYSGSGWNEVQRGYYSAYLYHKASGHWRSLRTHIKSSGWDKAFKKAKDGYYSAQIGKVNKSYPKFVADESTLV